MATITGTDASDYLVGSADADLVNGGLGNDTIRGLGGNDTLNGAEGNDDIDGGDGNDSLIGSAGNDTMQGGMNADTIDGGAGDDVLRGGKGFDSIVGGDGNDTLYSGLGNDTLTGGAGSDVFVVRGSDANFPGALKTPNITDFVAGTDSVVVEGATDADITAALAAQTTVDGGVSFSINGATVVVKGTGLTSLTASNVSNTLPTSNPGTSSTLTTSADNIAGTAGVDTIAGYINTTTATTGQTTFSGADVINGGDGADIFNLTVEGANAAGSLPAASITSVENFYVRDINTSGASTYDFATVTGEAQVWNDRSTQAVTFSNLAAGTTVGVKGDGSMTHGGTTFTLAAATNAVAIAIDGGVKGGNITRNATGEAAVTITSTGAANTVGTVDLDTGTAVKSVTIDATTNLTANLAADYAASSTLTIKGAGVVDIDGAALSAAITTVDASGSTGGAKVLVNQADTTVDTKFTGGSGNDTLDVGKVVYSSTTLTATGGDGTDTIKMNDQAALTSTTAKYITGFEVLELSDDNDAALDTFDMSLMSTLTALKLNADSAGDGYSITNMSATQAGNVTIAGTLAVTPTFGVTGAATVGQLDTLSIAINDGATAVNVLTVANLTAAGVETINLALTDSLTLSAATGLGAMTAMNLTGAGVANITTGALALNVNSTIDASALTGTFTIDASAATTNGIAIKGSSTKANTITGSAQADVITGGSAADSLLGGAGDDTISSGDGNDYISSGAGADAITTGAGNDLVEMTANASVLTFATVSDFAAGDALSFANKGTEVFTTAAVSLGGGSTLTDYMNAAAAGNGGTNGIVRWFQFEGNTYVVQDLSAGATFVANTDRAIKLTGLIDLSTATLSTANNTLTNGSGATETPSANRTITGTAGADTLTGGIGADTITGGTGADLMSGGTGADIFVQAGGDSVGRTSEVITVANLGNGETITFAAGVDVITDFVSGTDKLDVATAGSFTSFGAGGDGSNLTGNNNYSIRGDFNSGTGVFTTNFGGGADLLVVTNAANADLDAAGQSSIIILTGITSLAAGDFI
ncbi:beta strand repeat-containing protein [Oceanibaculum nanhaiense]|uniref:beta strand repeat-containing protein n=1 Tax=Oceanibaculum nanhaiense TaxID=1909734 RepID=UPI003D2BB771